MSVLPPTDSLRIEDRRKKKWLAHAGARVGRKTRSRTLLEIDWRSDLSLGAYVDGNTCRVRANDFPDKLMYSLNRVPLAAMDLSRDQHLGGPWKFELSESIPQSESTTGSEHG
jgi:hypothetical protein